MTLTAGSTPAELSAVADEFQNRKVFHASICSGLLSVTYTSCTDPAAYATIHPAMSDTRYSLAAQMPPYCGCACAGPCNCRNAQNPNNEVGQSPTHHNTVEHARPWRLSSERPNTTGTLNCSRSVAMVNSSPLPATLLADS